jgi:hypothetical protein
MANVYQSFNVPLPPINTLMQSPSAKTTLGWFFCFWLWASSHQYRGAAFLLDLLCPFNAATRVCTPGVYDGGKACYGIDGFYV